MSEEVPFEGDEPGPQDHFVIITIPGGVTSEEWVWHITDVIRALMQDEDRQYYTDSSWPNVLEGSQHLIKVSCIISFAPIFTRCLDFLYM